MHLAHTYIGIDTVERLALGILYLIHHIVEERRLGAPQLGLLQRHNYRHALHRCRLGMRHDLPAITNFNRKGIPTCDIIICRDYYYLFIVDIGYDLHTLQRHVVHGLHPHRLPNTRGTGIAATIRIVICRLLASGLRAAAKVALGMHHDAVLLAVTHEIRDIEREGVRTAVVAADEATVDIYLRLVIYGTEVELHALALPCRRNLYHALIPHAVDEIGIPYAREFALRCERHRDTLLEALAVIEIAVATRIRQIERKTPFAVQVDPVGSFELRAGILRTRLCAYGCRKQQGRNNN